jgi:hypothetical protein
MSLERRKTLRPNLKRAPRSKSRLKQKVPQKAKTLRTSVPRKKLLSRKKGLRKVKNPLQSLTNLRNQLLPTLRFKLLARKRNKE